MAVRNFWISAQIDGRNTPLSGGPRAKDGGFELTIYQRSEGDIITAATIQGFARADGTLKLRCEMMNDNEEDAAQEIEFHTKR